ncbi:MAG: PfkB family carbohydrate kinase [Candidatus Caldarchaeum sp.]
MKISVVGALTVDLIGDEPVVGGPPWYAGIAAHRCGAMVSLISTVGEDFPEYFFREIIEAGLDTSGVKTVKGARTYSFKPVFTESGRRLRLVSQGPRISLEQLEELDADAVIISPVFKELELEHLDAVRRRVERLTVDLQGFVRESGECGEIYLKPLNNTNVLKYAEVVHCSEEEAQAISMKNTPYEALRFMHRHGVGRCLLGVENGLYVMNGDSVMFIQVIDHQRVADTTGAGDILTGAFTALACQGLSAEESAVRALELVRRSMNYPPPLRVPERLTSSQPLCRVVWRKSVG